MSESESVNVNLHLDATDFQRVLLWYKWKMLVLILGIVMVFTTPLIFFASKRSVTMTSASIGVTIGFVFLIAFFRIRRQAKNGEERAEPTRVFFDNEGLHSDALTFSNETNWQRFVKIVETDADFIFFPQENLFYPIPKRFFETEDQISKLRILLRAHVGDKAKLKSSNG